MAVSYRVCVCVLNVCVLNVCVLNVLDVCVCVLRLILSPFFFVFLLLLRAAALVLLLLLASRSCRWAHHSRWDWRCS